MPMEKELERAAQKINHEVYYQLVKLTLHHNWLEEESLALTELWNLCSKRSEQNLLYDLIYRFNYLNSSQLNKNGKIIADQIVKEWKLEREKTKVIAVSDNRNSDGSLMLIQSIKNKFASFGWSENNFINNIGEGSRIVNEDDNVILLDDFIGSGTKIQRRVNWIINKLSEREIKGVTLKVVALAALEIGIKKLDELKIDYFIPIWLKKGISDYYRGEDLESAVNNMLALEELLEAEFKRLKLPSFSFGYKKSEALFAIESFNVPNNVFPIFWWPVLKGMKERNTLFKRLR
jgi:hypothetical protein